MRKCVCIFFVLAMARGAWAQQLWPSGVFWQQPVAQAGPPPQQWQYYNSGLPAPVSYAQPYPFVFSFSAGYSNIDFKDSDFRYESGGPYLDLNFAACAQNGSGLQGGIGIATSGYWRSDFFPTIGWLNSNVNMLAIEGRLGSQIPGKGSQGLFILPRIGAGLLLNNYYVEEPVGAMNWTSFSHWGTGVDVRPNVVIGFRANDFSVGLEGSYMVGWGDFGGLGSFVQEGRVGLVVSVLF
jgi:hypothetical protein